MTTLEALIAGTRVRHPEHGVGGVLLDDGDTIVVRFEAGVQICLGSDLEPIRSFTDKLDAPVWDPPLEVVNRLQAESIRSVNDAWGTFSRSRIELLPHQLWVCRQVTSVWPARWLVADDVGLGKTIEAGMVLSSLLARGRARRILIVCPASLVEQWQYRLRTMFDIRMASYATAADTDRGDFWGVHNQVVASLQTLRNDSKGRQQRLLDSEPWDLLIVDEAHHLNADEEAGPTLGYTLIKRLIEAGRIQSMVFFTGTPHRGKDYGFLSLLALLRSDLFDARMSMRDQLTLLPQVMIRNCKNSVTDLQGQRLFQRPTVYPETYAYSPDEQKFYDLLSTFIETGEAWASRLGDAQGRTVMLVLIAMQKLASSSVAAIRRALRGRLGRIEQGRDTLQELSRQYQEERDGADGDRLSVLEEQIVQANTSLRLVENEAPALKELLEAADSVQAETKISKILELLHGSLAGRSVLFFTEYKATQSLLMSALYAKYGEGCVAFINGDCRAEDVRRASGATVSISQSREEAAHQFNSGQARFLVSTEAGGEGIDLQERCYTLIHVDLPWNPMRLHQRVGRLNRYGQQERVEVFTLRNPDTVEARIWDRLEQKLQRIEVALGQVMDEPEDMLQLVLGMASSSLFTELFAGARRLRPESVDQWFDQKTVQFGGQDAIQTVQEIVGSTSRFDFREISNPLPRVDLPDLRSFFENSLVLNGRRVREDPDGGITFQTPDSWRTDSTIRPQYQSMIFDRLSRSEDAQKRLLGVGHRLVDQALVQALKREVAVAVMPPGSLAAPVTAFAIRDRVTGPTPSARVVVVAVEIGDDGTTVIMKDWELLQRLNSLPARRPAMNKSGPRPAEQAQIADALSRGRVKVENHMAELEHGFRLPELEAIAILWPDVGGERVADEETAVDAPVAEHRTQLPALPADPAQRLQNLILSWRGYESGEAITDLHEACRLAMGPGGAQFLPARLELLSSVDETTLRQLTNNPRGPAYSASLKFRATPIGRFDLALVPYSPTGQTPDRWLLVLDDRIPGREQVALYAHAVAHLLLDRRRLQDRLRPHLDPKAGYSHVDTLTGLRLLDKTRHPIDRLVVESYPKLADLANAED